MFAHRVLFAAIAVLGMAACSSVPYAQRIGARQAAYREAARDPVRSFRFFELYSWEPLGDSQLAIYTRPNEAYLVSVMGPCPDLEFTDAIGLTSNLNEVQVRFDKVLTGRRDIPCTIGEIRPVDLARLKSVEHEQRKIQSAQRAAAAADQPSP
ncbi:hypothetical protein FHW84_000648 [Dyella sp. SG562]|uniref:DUF6491 family protein n=1 Tax=Dyella TaxID=231454 RepID=UPI00141DE479|nr:MULTISPECIES: DUF6491 family protein [unclassified Dyella]NII72092.1 hypothetical protein [Dyella sp. SG562]NKJ23201.1 hypothetical protein [Dyella sp. SG609]